MEPFKSWFSPRLVSCLADHVSRHVPGFDRRQFEASICGGLDALELKARAQLIADRLHEVLPQDPGERAGVLVAMLHPDEDGHTDQPSDSGGISGWGVMPLTLVVGQHGIADFDRSMEVLRQMTKRSSSEFAIRYFMLADQSRTLDIVKGWLGDPNRHVRRLISEGTRPRLPWAMQLPQLMADPSPMLPMLKHLRDDEHEYVRRSVANHLNDIAKDHPDRVAQLAKSWMRGADENRQKLIRHGCRTLVKAGHKTALEAFGLMPPRLELGPLEIATPEVEFGGKLEFSVAMRSTSLTQQELVVDYLVHFKKANGKLSPKVFKWSKFTLEPCETRQLHRAHAIRPITTRRYYGGQHGLSLRINGEDFDYAKFTLNLA